MEERFDVWLFGFGPEQHQPVEELQRVFGIDADRARRFVADTPLVVKHAVPLHMAESMAAALRSIGGEVGCRHAAEDEAAAHVRGSSLPPKPPEKPWQDRTKNVVAVGRPSSPPRLFMPLSTPPVATPPAEDEGGNMLGYKALFAFVLLLILGLGFAMVSRRNHMAPNQVDQAAQKVIKGPLAVDASAYLERGDLLASTAVSEHLRPVVNGLYEAGAVKVWAIARPGQSNFSRFGGVLFVDGMIVELPASKTSRSAIVQSYVATRPSDRRWNVPKMPEAPARFWRINVH